MKTKACKSWRAAITYKGIRVVIPEIADYEVRRELLRAEKSRGIDRLDALKNMLEYGPITTSVMLRAAEFSATARKMGRQSAADASLDADVILAAQAVEITRGGDQGIIATTNVRHLTLFSPARLWSDIS